MLPASLLALATARRIRSSPFRARDGFVGVTSAWIVGRPGHRRARGGRRAGDGSYAAIPESRRWFLLLLMLAGRLEIFTILVLLTPAFWRRGVA